MLKPTSDRIDYGKLLMPPDGYIMESAVGTSYSLDLDALVGVCMAMGLSAEPDNETLNNPIYLLELLRRTGDKVTLFCQAGQIKVPAKHTSLYILLEKMVCPLQPRRSLNVHGMPSFHPKFWLISYVSKQGDKRYRLIVLSRNLTFDRSWDIAACLEGAPAAGAQEKSRPIADFLQYLQKRIPSSTREQSARRKRFAALIKEIEQVEFQPASREFKEFEFIPVGVPKANGTVYGMSHTPLFSSTFNELFVMSPFLSGSVIAEFNQRNKLIQNPKCVLVTRRESLARLRPDQCDKFRIYTMKDLVVEGESAISEDRKADSPEGADIRRQDIHAKVYLWNRGSASELVLGSLNASHSALNGNVECVLRLISQRRFLSLDSLTKDLFGGEPDNPDNPFELTALDEGIAVEDDVERRLEHRIRQISVRTPKAKAEPMGELYRLTISFSGLTETEGEGVTIAPLFSYKEFPLEEEILIENIPLLQLSEFYRVTAREGEHKIQRLIKIPTADLPDSREEAVVQDVIKDTQTFYQYLAFLLGDDYLISALEHGDLNKSWFKSAPEASLPALYERMLQAAATSPEKFSEISYILKMIRKDGVIPGGFHELYDAFRKAVGNRE